MTTIATPGAATARGPVAPAAGGRRHPVLRSLARRPLAVAAAAYLAAVSVAAVGAPWLAPRNPQTQDLAHVLAGPGAAHWLGTDRLGRDVASRLMFGGRVTLTGVLEALVVFAVVGLTLGLAGGFLGGWAGRLIAAFGDLVLALPGVIVLLMVLSVFGGSELAAMIALGFISSPALLRVVRGATLAIRNEPYLKAARLAGLTTPRIIGRHVLPRLAGPVIVQLSLFCATAVLVQGALSFLGLATPETQGPSWGNMIAEASDVLSTDPWLLVPAGGVLALTVLALGLLGDAVRDATTERSRAPRPRVRRRGTGRRRPSPAGSRPSAAGTRPSPAGTRPSADGACSPAGAAPPPRGQPLLAVQGLTIAFPGERGEQTVVRDVSFEVAAGETVGIVGESGCGKTVTARSLLGLLPGGGRITSGAILLGGRDLAGLHRQDLAAVRGAVIGLISQEPMSALDPAFGVGSQLTEVIRRHSTLSRSQARARACELLDMVRMPEPARVLRCYPHELSGGMAQRASIALALAGNPRLLVADEPTTALDVTVQAGILDLLRDLRDQLGMAIIMVTHDWGVLADLCDRAVVMYAGEVVEQAKVADLYRAPRHPYTRGLLAANPVLAPPGDPLPAIPGTVPAPSAWPAGCHFRPRCGYATDRCAAGPVPVATLGHGRLSRCIHHDRLVAP